MDKHYHTSIGHIPDEILLEIFDQCRLGDRLGWNHRRQWYTPLHVCRKWRYLMLESASRLKLRLLCNSRTPTAKMLMYSPPLPLIVIVDSIIFKTTQSQENTLLALQHSDRISSILINSWSSELFMTSDRTFRTLETLSLSSSIYQPVVLPDNFVAPHLRSLHLRDGAVSALSSLLANAAASIISFKLDGIQRRSHLLPEDLVECISSMPQLEILSISLDPLYSLPLRSVETRLWLMQSTPVVLPCLLELTLMGGDAYLEKLLTLVSTPLLQCFRITILPHLALAVQSLPEFFSTIKNLEFRTVVVSIVSFSGTVTITYLPRQPSDSPSSFMFGIGDDFDQLNRLVATMVQICTAAAPILRGVEGLSLELYDDWAADVRSELWYTFLRSFGALKALQVDLALTPELCDVLNPRDGAATEELVPMLSELVVLSRDDLIHNAFATFIHSRRLAGHPINFRTIKQRPPLHSRVF